MKYFIAFAIALFSWAWYIQSNWYPFGYPVHQGDVWKLTIVWNTGTPIERMECHTIVVDSMYEGYIIKDHIYGTDIAWSNGLPVNRFMGSLANQKMELISRIK